MKKRWMKDFASKTKPALIEGEIHVFASPCMAECMAKCGGVCVLDNRFTKGNLSEGKTPVQTWVFAGVYHRATVYVYEGSISEAQAKSIAVSQAKHWR